MKRKERKTKLVSEINITPFTDVVLVLLIIFMVATPMLMQSGIKIKLPQTATVETESDRALSIVITASGDVMIDDKKCTIDDVKDRVASQISGSPNMPVVVKADREVKYDVVVRVLDAAKQSGAKKLALATEGQKIAR